MSVWKKNEAIWAKTVSVTKNHVKTILSVTTELFVCACACTICHHTNNAECLHSRLNGIECMLIACICYAERIYYINMPQIVLHLHTYIEENVLIVLFHDLQILLEL